MKSCTDRENLDIEEHLQICEHCHSRFHQAEEWVALMKIAIPLGPMPSRASPSGWRLSVERLLSKPLVAAGYAAVAIALCASPLLMLRNRFAGEEVVLLAATRGGADSGPPTASSRNRLRLRIDTTDLDGPLEAQIVDASGTTVASSTLAASNPEVVLDHKLERGSSDAARNWLEGAVASRLFHVQQYVAPDSTYYDRGRAVVQSRESNFVNSWTISACDTRNSGSRLELECVRNRSIPIDRHRAGTSDSSPV
jgi:hypothetical protein